MEQENTKKEKKDKRLELMMGVGFTLGVEFVAVILTSIFKPVSFKFVDFFYMTFLYPLIFILGLTLFFLNRKKYSFVWGLMLGFVFFEILSFIFLGGV